MTRETLNRKPIFDTVRTMLGRGFSQAEVNALDAAIDRGFAGDAPAPVASEFPWMAEAYKHLGLTEIPGKQHNPTILRWIRGLGGWFTDDETPWCGTFNAHCLRTAGIAVPKHWYRAKAYLEWGVPCSARVGAVAIFGRKGGGHVGFVVGEGDSNLYILGGNQRNQVNITPIATSRLLGIRWPHDQALGMTSLPRMTGGRRTTNEA